MRKEMSVIYRSPVWNDTASLAVIDTSAFVREAALRHSLAGGSKRAYARVAAVAAYLCGWAEEEQTVSLTVNGNGLCGKFHLFGNGKMQLCGSVERANVGAETSVPACVGRQGYWNVVLDGGAGLPFEGTCALETGDITGDAQAYFEKSEQRPTAIALFEQEDERGFSCGGVFLQPLTGAGEEVLLRAREAVNACAGLPAKEILARFGAERAEGREIVFACSCSAEKAARAIVSLGKEGALALLRSEGEIRVHCHECNTDYRFNQTDVEELFAKQKG